MNAIEMTWAELERIEAHPAADIFPMIQGEAWEDFVGGMREKGYYKDFPLVVYNGKLLDGRNRLKSALLIHREGSMPCPPPVLNRTTDDPYSYVVAANVKRRNLSTSDLATIAAKIYEPLAEEGKAKRKAAGDQGGRGNKKNLLPDLVKGFSEENRNSAVSVAKQFGIGHSTLSNAVAIKKKEPELFKQIERGEKTVDTAYKEMKAAQKGGEEKPPRRNDPRVDANGKPWVNPGDRPRTLNLFTALDIPFSARQVREFYSSLNERFEFIQLLAIDIVGADRQRLIQILSKEEPINASNS